MVRFLLEELVGNGQENGKALTFDAVAYAQLETRHKIRTFPGRTNHAHIVLL